MKLFMWVFWCALTVSAVGLVYAGFATARAEQIIRQVERDTTLERELLLKERKMLMDEVKRLRAEAEVVSECLDEARRQRVLDAMDEARFQMARGAK